MEKIEKLIAKVTTTWLAIGVFITGLGITGGFADIVAALSSVEIIEAFKEFANLLVAAGGAGLSFFQILRAAIGINKPKPDGEEPIEALSTGAKASYMFNPFKLHV